MRSLDPGLPSLAMQQRVAELLEERDRLALTPSLPGQADSEQTIVSKRCKSKGARGGADEEQADWLKFLESRKPVPLAALPLLIPDDEALPAPSCALPRACPKAPMLAAAEAALAFPWRAGTQSLLYGCQRAHTLPIGEAAAEPKPIKALPSGPLQAKPKTLQALPAGPWETESAGPTATMTVTEPCSFASAAALKACAFEADAAPPPAKRSGRPTSLPSLKAKDFELAAEGLQAQGKSNVGTAAQKQPFASAEFRDSAAEVAATFPRPIRRNRRGLFPAGPHPM